MEISKIDAARRQLDAAIELYFSEGDEVAIHTLAAAAYEIIAALRTKAGHSDGIEEWIIPERRREFQKLWTEAQNFFKHADRDADETLEFKPAQTEVRLFMACLQYASLGPKTQAMIAFQAWYSLHNVELLLDPEVKAVVGELGKRWAGTPRHEFRRLMAEAAASQGYRPWPPEFPR